MRVYYKRYVQHLGKMEQCMQLVQDKDASIRKLNKMIKMRLIMMDKYKARGSGGSITSEATPMPPNPYAKTPSVRSHQSQKSLPKEDKVPRPCESPPPPRRGKWVNGRFVRPQEDEEEEPVQEEYTTPWEEEAADWGDHASEIRKGQKAKEAMDHDPTRFDKKSGAGTEYSYASDWVHSKEWGWYRRSKWDGESTSGTASKVQTKTEELAEVIAELTAKFPDGADLFKRLIELIATNWREESLPSLSLIHI